MSYRQGVAIIIVSNDRTNVLVGERTKQPGQWQIPQGGIDGFETPHEALERELFEETGLKLPIVLSKTTAFIRYDWPAGLFAKQNYKGQEHIYFVLEGRDVALVQLRPTEEFAQFKWHPIADLINITIDWKRAALTQALRELNLVSA